LGTIIKQSRLLSRGSIIPSKEAEDEKWLVCFVESKSHGWWKVFTFQKKIFGHIFALRYDAVTNSWLHFEWSTSGLNVTVLSRWDIENWIVFLAKNGVVLEVIKKKIEATFMHCGLFPIYCVSAMRHLLGVKKICLTPHSLHCELKKNGGQYKFGTERNI